MRKLFSSPGRTTIQAVWCVLSVFILLAPPALTYAQQSNDDIQSIVGQTPFYDPNAQPCQQPSATTILVGTDNEEKIWNFFVGQGLSGQATAGIMGNLQQESTFDPSAHQTAGAWADMSNNYNEAVGLFQWDGGNRPQMIKAAESQGLALQVLETSSDQNLAWQLNYSLGQMKGTSPTGTQNVFGGLQKSPQSTDPKAAATFFNHGFESGSDPGGVRESNAATIYAKYSGGGGGGSSSSSSSGGCSTSQTGANCTQGSASVTGLAKIYCEALRFNHKASYSETALGDHMGSNTPWINQVCPQLKNNLQGATITPSCLVDCSGLVNISVYLAFGYDLNENTTSERADEGKLWKVIPRSAIQTGDLIQPAAEAGGHVEIIDKVQNGIVYTMGAHTSNAPQPDQVDTVSYPTSPGDLYLQWIGPQK